MLGASAPAPVYDDEHHEAIDAADEI